MTEYDTYFNISTNTLDTILLLHIITKYEIDKPTIDWSVVQDHLVKEFSRLKDLKLISSDSLIDSLKTEDDIKSFYNKIQDVFSKNHINLESFLRNSRKELLKSKIEELNKELKEKEDGIQLIKSNYLEQLMKEQQQQQLQQSEIDEKDQQQQQSESELVEVKDEDEDQEDEETLKNQQKEKEKEKSNATSTPKSKRKHSTLSTPQQTKEELDDEQQLALQKKKEEEQQKANNIKKILSTSLAKVWKTINSNRYAYIFRYPISKEDAPDYDKVIKHRMDLTTLKKKLDDNLYNNCSEFNKDLLLIFKNAMVYNEEDSDIYNAAIFMKKSAEKEMEACFATEELLYSGAANSLGTRSNRGPTTTNPTTTSATNLSTSTNSTTSTTGGNTSGPSTPSLSTTTMPSPSIRGRTKITSSSSTTTTRSSSKKNSESDQSNPNTPSLQEDSIDFSDDNNPTTPRSNKTITSNTPTSTSRSRSSAKKQAQAEAEAESNSKKVSKRQRNSKIDETITHQDE